jgi:hypothetical protein
MLGAHMITNMAGTTNSVLGNALHMTLVGAILGVEALAVPLNPCNSVPA